MRNAILLGLVFTLALGGAFGGAFGGVALAEEEEAPAPAPKRGFADGTFVDPYFGLTYEAPGLEEGFGPGLGGPQVLWSGKAEGGVSVELIVLEGPEQWDGAEWMARVKKAWEADGKERKDVEEGTEPQPWILYVQESLAGFQRQHGFAFYPRGYQCFQVHAQVREKSETSGEAIKKALQGLTVEASKDDCFFLAHFYASRANMSPDDPQILLMSAFGREQQGAPGYLGQDPRFKNPYFALRVLELAKEKLGTEDLNADAKWQLNSGIGLAQLTMGKHEEAIPTWEKCIELAKETSDPANFLGNSDYNLACAYALLGRLDEAYGALTSCFEKGDEAQVAGLKKHAKEDPDLEKMRTDERWKDVVGG